MVLAKVEDYQNVFSGRPSMVLNRLYLVHFQFGYSVELTSVFDLWNKQGLCHDAILRHQSRADKKSQQTHGMRDENLYHDTVQ